MRNRNHMILQGLNATHFGVVKKTDIIHRKNIALDIFSSLSMADILLIDVS
ncbi:hypothetical protein [Rheinheimera maricola]|uniref:Uncharacterized protein n=1 Tax=Rheinheimera maricola TaxID=2793282 RepID=A0ABS7X8N5_9GAMM|nr:hypothetical protein [Rheinheimera maricola]MBZ9611905.1 hypothetical protein [Rheinheimera maricola]